MDLRQQKYITRLDQVEALWQITNFCQQAFRQQRRIGREQRIDETLHLRADVFIDSKRMELLGKG